jgi:hypothetical protein
MVNSSAAYFISAAKIVSKRVFTGKSAIQKAR